MRNLLAPLPFIALTFLCWGNYGPLMQRGQAGMDFSHMRPFVCVGIAYFLIAVVVPIVILATKGESGGWTGPGLFWSLTAGVLGAVGAFGIILAFENRGSPVYVMPLVFGGAPVVNTFVTMWMSKTFRSASLMFFVCVALVAIGAACVLVFKPSKTNVNINVNAESGAIEIVEHNTADDSKTVWNADSFEDLQSNPKNQKPFQLYQKGKKLEVGELIYVVLSILLAALCWGSYGPILHKGQAKMLGSRLRPFLCVGISYFVVAVVLPMIALSIHHEEGSWFPNNSPAGVLWSLGAGAAGAVGALGIIMAFNFGGRPIFVMPLVFGMAPIVNTITTITSQGMWSQVRPPFFGSLLVVICGAVGVLLFSPKPGAPAKTAESKKPKPPKEEPAKVTEAEKKSDDQGNEPVLDDSNEAPQASPSDV